MNNNIILKQKQAKILIALKDTTQNWYISTIAKASNTTYVHACNFLAECESLGITTSEKHGKIKLIRLTEKGLRLAELISSINTMVSVQEQPQKQQVEQSK